MQKKLLSLSAMTLVLNGSFYQKVSYAQEANPWASPQTQPAAQVPAQPSYNPPPPSRRQPAPNLNLVPSVQEVSSETTETVVPSSEINNTKQNGTGIALFFGLDGGYSLSTTKDADIETRKQGFQIGGKGLASIYTDTLVFDLGCGWLYNRLNGPGIALKANEAATDIQIITQAGYAEFSPRYRVDKNWQIGGVAQVFFGTDVTFGPSEGASRPSILGGMALMYGVPEKNFDLRYGIQLLTDVTIRERQLYWGLFTVQIGLPLVKPEPVVRERRTVVVRERIKREQIQVPVEKIVEKIVVRDVVKFSFDADLINFQYKESTLTPKSLAFVKDLAKLLIDKKDAWTSLVIEGHTDNRGTPDYNAKLSKDRSLQVKAQLVTLGVPAERIQTNGYGSLKPLDPADSDLARARNRRVEMLFQGVKDPKPLQEGMSRIRFLHHKPTTCEGKSCK